ncbi:MAG: carbohydrate kinase [Pseudomonadota bacterium]
MTEDQRVFLVCGEALFDFFQTQEEAKRLSFEAIAGGSPFNVAIGIARQGGRSALLTGISNDLLGTRLMSALEAEAVDTRYVIRSGRRTTLSLVALTGDGHPEYAFYGLGSADCSLTPGQMPDLDDTISGIHFGSYSIAVSPVADAFAHLASRERDRFISLDPNVRPTVVADPAIWRQRIDALLPFADLVKTSAEDLSMLFPDTDTGSVAETYLIAGAKLVVITDGSNDVRAYRRSGKLTVTPPKLDVVDTVGAGDAFQASLLAQLMAHREPQHALTALSDDAMVDILAGAARVAAVTCTRRGADIPAREASG